MRYKVLMTITSETPDSPTVGVLSTKRLHECATYEEAVDFVRDTLDKINQPNMAKQPHETETNNEQG